MNRKAITIAVRAALLSTASACLSLSSFAVYAHTLHQEQPGVLVPHATDASRHSVGSTVGRTQTVPTEAKSSKSMSAAKQVPGASKEQKSASIRAETLSTIHVTGVARALLRETTTKRDNIGLVDSISAEETGKFPDPTIASALQRVPGVAVNRNVDGEADEISVRGFGPSFVNVLLNGHRMATTSFSRAFDLDVLPVQILQKAVVYKSSQVTLPAGGIGGTVNIITWKPLQFHGFHASARLGAMRQVLPGANENSIKPRLSGMIGDTTKNGKFGWLLAAVYEQRAEQYTSIETNWNRRILSLISPTKTFVVPADFAYRYNFQNRTRRSADLSLEWQPTNELSLNGNFLLTKYTGNRNRLAYDIFTEATVIKSVKTDSHDTATSFETNTVPGQQAVFQTGQFRKNIKLTSSYIDLKYQLGGGNSFNVMSALSIAQNKIPLQFQNGNLGYLINASSPVTFHNPGAGKFGYFTGGSGTTDLSNLREHFPEPGKHAINEHLFANTISFRHDFEGGPVSFVEGGISSAAETHKNRDFSLPDNGDFLVPYFDAFNVHIPPSAIQAHIVTINNLGGEFGEKIPKSFITYSPSDNFVFLQSPAAFSQLSPALRKKYLSELAQSGGLKVVPRASAFSRVREIDNSAYALVNFESSFAGHLWSMQLGLRYTHTTLASKSLGQPLLALEFDPGDLEFATPVFAGISPIVNNGSYDFLLPSVNFKFHLLPNVLLRAAYSKTLTRPPLGDLKASEAWGTENRITQTTGNADLKPYLSTNYDVGIGWFVGPVSYMSFDVFRKNVKNFITTITTAVPTHKLVPKVSPLLKASLVGPGVFVTKPVNLNKATVEGFEATVNYRFRHLPGLLNGIGIATNYTHVTSSTSITSAEVKAGKVFALPGMGNSYNASLYYDKDGVSMRLAYNFRDNYLVSISGTGALPISAGSFGELDFSASYNFSKHWTAYLDASNLNNASVFQYAIYTNRPTLGSVFGRRYQIGVRWKF